MNAIDPIYRARAARGAAGANKRWAKREPWSAYVLPATSSSRWVIRWARRRGKYKAGSVDTREEAEAILAIVVAALRAGIEPPTLPRGRAKAGAPQTSTRSNEEIDASRTRIRKVLSEAERCALCGLLKPCSPCIGEQRTELLSAGRRE